MPMPVPARPRDPADKQATSGSVRGLVAVKGHNGNGRASCGTTRRAVALTTLFLLLLVLYQ
jgi:hypothetical protein